MLIELNLQFDKLPVEVSLIQQKQQNSEEISVIQEYDREHSALLNVYFEDQHCRQQQKSEQKRLAKKAGQYPEEYKTKKINRRAYFLSYKKKMRCKKEFRNEEREMELLAKQSARANTDVKKNKVDTKQFTRANIDLRTRKGKTKHMLKNLQGLIQSLGKRKGTRKYTLKKLQGLIQSLRKRKGKRKYMLNNLQGLI